MASSIYRWINPIVRTVLRSPFHRILSGNTLLLEFTGRKSGRTYSTPVSYHEQGGQVHCFTAHQNIWWRNLQGGAQVGLLVAGKRGHGVAQTEVHGPTDIVPALRAFLAAVPRDASSSGVRLDQNKQLREDDLAAAAKTLVHIAIDPAP